MTEVQETPTQKLRLMRAGFGDELVAEWTSLFPDTVCRARDAFRTSFTSGRMAFRIDGPGLTRPITEFEEDAQEILIVPAITGG